MARKKNKKSRRKPEPTGEAATWGVVVALHETRTHFPRGSAVRRQFTDKQLRQSFGLSRGEIQHYRKLSDLELGIAA